MTCPSVEDLVLHSEEPRTDSPVVAHISSCDSCRGRLDEILGLKDLEREVREAARIARPGSFGTRVLPRIPGHQVVRELHRGGQGIVYEAIQESTRRSVAVKLLHEGVFASPRRLKRFEREVELAARLDHPHIVTVHDRGQTPEGHQFLVMELVEGQPANGSGVPLTEVLELFANICDAVEFAHQRGVLHRDLKPANILVDARGEPHVLDFGLAKGVHEELGSDTGLTREGEFLGTLAYASPEHVSGDLRQIDARSDVYSLGILLYELMTGTYPYPVEGSMAGVIRSITEAVPKPPGVNPDVDTIALRCIAKEKERRYQSAALVASDVRRFLRGEPIAARRDSAVYVMGKALRRHRWFVTAGIAAILALLAVGYIAMRRGDQARQQGDLASHEARLKQERARFLDEVVLSSGWKEGRVALMKQALDKAAERIADDPASDPRTQVELERWLGWMYRYINYIDLSFLHFERALDQVMSFEEEDLGLQADLLTGLGAAHDSLRNKAESHRLLEKALELKRRALGPDHPDTAFSEVILAVWEYAWGKEQDAADRLQAAEPNMERDSTNRAECLSWLGLIHWDRGDLDASERNLSESRRIWEQTDDVTGGTRHAATLHHLGQTLMSLGRLEEAAQVLEESWRRLESLWGERGADTIHGLILLAQCKAQQDGIVNAEELFEKAMSFLPVIRESPDRPDARTLAILAELADLSGDPNEAVTLYQEALQLYDTAFGPEYSRLTLLSQVIVRNNLADVLRRLARFEEAEETARGALADAEKIKNDRSLAYVHKNLAQILFSRRRSEPALDHARQALALYREIDEDGLFVASALLEVAWIQYFGYGESVESRSLAKQSLAIREERLAEDDPQIADCLHLLGWIHFAQGDTRRAEPLLRRALDIRREKLHPYHPKLGWTLNAMSVLELGRKNDDLALSLAEEAYDLCRDMEGQDDDLVSNTLHNVARALRRKGYDEEACPILQERYALLQRTQGEASASARQVRSELLSLLTSLGKHAEAKALREQGR